NLIRTQFRDTGAMKTSISTFVCPTRRQTATVADTFTVPGTNNSSEGICGDYGVDYGSGTSNATANDGAFRWNAGNDIGMRIAELTDGTSNTFLIGEKHVQQGTLGKVGPDANNVIGEDFCIYNSYQWFWSGRKAGTGFPLALGPNDPTRGIFGSW